MKTVKLTIVIFLYLFASCDHTSHEAGDNPADVMQSFHSLVIAGMDSLPDSHLTELLPGDILIKPNFCLLPGMLRLSGGRQFGHAAIVVRGASDTNEAELLKKVAIFESQARDVPAPFQLRITPAYVPGDDFRTASYNFSPDKLGNLYRLRFDLTENQIDSIISYVLDQDNDLSSYRAVKRYTPDDDSLHRSPEDGGKLEYWYCSLLIWQAFYDVLGIDLDADKGAYVYPNDLVYSRYFDDTAGEMEKRVRF